MLPTQNNHSSKSLLYRKEENWWSWRPFAKIFPHVSRSILTQVDTEILRSGDPKQECLSEMVAYKFVSFWGKNLLPFRPKSIRGDQYSFKNRWKYRVGASFLNGFKRQMSFVLCLGFILYSRCARDFARREKLGYVNWNKGKGMWSKVLFWKEIFTKTFEFSIHIVIVLFVADD